jgi:hypothetical protein
LNALVDTVFGLQDEGYAEVFIAHKKSYRGVIRPDYFEIKRKFVIGVLPTYNPWIIRGDFNAVGSNIALELSTNRTKTLRESLMTFVVLPLIILVIIFFKEDQRPLDYVMLAIAIIVPFAYHFISRWLQVLALNRFIRILEKSIHLSKIPQ